MVNTLTRAADVTEDSTIHGRCWRQTSRWMRALTRTEFAKVVRQVGKCGDTVVFEQTPRRWMRFVGPFAVLQSLGMTVNAGLEATSPLTESTTPLIATSAAAGLAFLLVPLLHTYMRRQVARIDLVDKASTALVYTYTLTGAVRPQPLRIPARSLTVDPRFLGGKQGLSSVPLLRRDKAERLGLQLDLTGPKTMDRHKLQLLLKASVT